MGGVGLDLHLHLMQVQPDDRDCAGRCRTGPPLCDEAGGIRREMPGSGAMVEFFRLFQISSTGTRAGFRAKAPFSSNCWMVFSGRMSVVKPAVPRASERETQQAAR